MAVYVLEFTTQEDTTWVEDDTFVDNPEFDSITDLLRAVSERDFAPEAHGEDFRHRIVKREEEVMD